MLYQHPSQQPRQTVRLGLMITCRIAAEEMKDIAFYKISFSARSSVNDGSTYMGLDSLAGRFQCCKWVIWTFCTSPLTKGAIVLNYVEHQKCRMLVCVAELL